MSRPVVFIDGEAGTTGLQIRARLVDRGDLELAQIPSAQRKDPLARREYLNAADVVILCLPDDAARDALKWIDNPRVRVLDASSAHRTQPDWVYGFPELTPEQPRRIREAMRVANPGCYATAAIALLRPVVDAGLLPADAPVSIHAVEGYSGGGRSLIDAFEGRSETPIHDPVRLYALGLRHKHVPEIRLHGRLGFTPLFLPSVGAFAQGELVHIPLPLRAMGSKARGADFHAALAAHYAGARFVRVQPLAPAVEVLAPQALNGTNQMELFVFENEAEGLALLVARLDNLGKGASGAAAQNLDLMLGLDGHQDYRLKLA
jgi:N-acetyl-gamma-glutamyl-phosphate reductase